MNYYKDVYSKRVNRYGLDYQSRVQAQRERDFDNYLLKTLNRVDFEYNGKLYGGSLEQYKQDEKKTQMYLLTKKDVEMRPGSIISVIGASGGATSWLVWWKEDKEAGGYDKYVVLKMTHTINWTVRGQSNSQLAYFYGTGNRAINDADFTGAGKTLYFEDDNLGLFITPYNKDFARGGYLEIFLDDGNKVGYSISEMDVVSTQGIEYLSVDPTPLRDLTPAAEPEEGESEEDYYWLRGEENGCT